MNPIERGISAFVSKLKSLGLADSTINEILTYSDDMICDVSDSYIDIVKSMQSCAVTKSILEDMSILQQSCSDVLKNVSTKYKRKVNYKKSQFFVRNVESLSTRWETRYCRTTKKYRQK